MAKPVLKRSVPSKGKSPLRKKKHVSPVLKKQAYTNWIDSCATQVDDIIVSWATKYNAPQAAYIGPMRKAFQEHHGDYAEWKMIAIIPRRDPTTTENRYMPGRDGSSFTWDCIVSERCNAEDTPSALGEHIATKFTEFGRTATEFQIPPKFTFRRELTAPPLRPLNAFLCDGDCLLLLRRFYAEENEKEDVMANDDLMESFFGSVELGRQMIVPMTPEAWHQIE